MFRTTNNIGRVLLKGRGLMLLPFAVFGLLFASVFSASSASAIGPCPASVYVCVYSNSNFGGDNQQVYSGNPHFCWNLYGAMAGTTSSLINNTSYAVTFYNGFDCGGGCYFTQSGGGYRRNLNFDHWDGNSFCRDLTNANDQIYSFYI